MDENEMMEFVVSNSMVNSSLREKTKDMLERSWQAESDSFLNKTTVTPNAGVIIKTRTNSSRARYMWRKIRVVVAVLTLGDYLKKRAIRSDFSVYLQGTYVWIEDKELCFRPGKVISTFHQGQEGRVQLVELDGSLGEVVAVSMLKLLRMEEDSFQSLPDMLQLKSLNNASLLHNLRNRFAQDDIYTAVGSIMVSINPFKSLDVCTSDSIMRSYQSTSTMPPHLYQLAQDAYTSLSLTNQSCIVSGESGSGKTEATKIFLKYITSVSEDLGSDSNLKERIFRANPIMESFGNAMTLRNNNSSRFGKWIKIEFQENTKAKRIIIGGSVTNYLLEKSRIVGQTTGERNYHVFYQLVSVAETKLSSLYGISDSTTYTIMEGSHSEEDSKNWDVLMNSMSALGMKSEEIEDVVTTLCAILHLGNFIFEPASGEGSQITSPAALEHVCTLVGLNPTKLSNVLLSRSIRIPGQKEVILKPRTVEDAIESRNVMVKAIYSQLFDHLISNVINASLCRTEGKQSDSFIGVLDIFGFECFDLNSFEQLCINYCNEKLQFHFNQFIFTLELKEYLDQGIDVSALSFQNNQECLNLLEAGKGIGIFANIDDHNQMKYATDETMLKKLVNTHEKHPHFKDPGPLHKTKFIVVHYAGEVIYNVIGFLKKNQDLVHEDITLCLQEAQHTLVNKLFRGEAKSGNKKTLGSKFKNQLSELMVTLEATNPHFVRCLKPNDLKKGDLFDSKLILNQLCYAGLLEVCRIRKIGYPVRKTLEDFFKRYRVIAPSSDSLPSLCDALAKMGLLVKPHWQLGSPPKGSKHSPKLFMRASQFDDLEVAYELALVERVVQLQNFCRVSLQRKAETAWILAVYKMKQAMTVKADLKVAVEHAESTWPFQAGGMVHSSLEGYNYASNGCHAVMMAYQALETMMHEEKLVAKLQSLLERLDESRAKEIDLAELETLIESLKDAGSEDPLVYKAAKVLAERVLLQEREQLQEDRLDELMASMPPTEQLERHHIAILSRTIDELHKLNPGHPRLPVAKALVTSLIVQYEANLDSNIPEAVIVRSMPPPLIHGDSSDELTMIRALLAAEGAHDTTSIGTAESWILARSRQSSLVSDRRASACFSSSRQVMDVMGTKDEENLIIALRTMLMQTHGDAVLNHFQPPLLNDLHLIQLLKFCLRVNYFKIADGMSSYIKYIKWCEQHRATRPRQQKLILSSGLLTCLLGARSKGDRGIIVVNMSLVDHKKTCTLDFVSAFHEMVMFVLAGDPTLQVNGFDIIIDMTHLYYLQYDKGLFSNLFSLIDVLPIRCTNLLLVNIPAFLSATFMLSSWFTSKKLASRIKKVGVKPGKMEAIDQYCEAACLPPHLHGTMQVVYEELAGAIYPEASLISETDLQQMQQELQNMGVVVRDVTTTSMSF